MVSAADYRSGWLMEAMANYAALQFLEQAQGPGAMHDALTTYRADLEHQENGKPIDSAGPVDFGERLIETAGSVAWHTIVYEKGAWVLHMLQQRLGPENFAQMQARLLREFSTHPIRNDDFRKVASDFIPAGQPDKTLSLFFDTWVYGTGIPKMSIEHSGDDINLNLSGVDEDFIADVPLRCRSGRWQRTDSLGAGQFRYQLRRKGQGR